MEVDLSLGIPLAFSALLFAAFALAAWRPMPLVGRIFLGVATAFALGALAHPGMSIGAALDETRDGLTYVLAIARVAGFTAVLVCAATLLRRMSVRG
jgi:hypothetical protein